MLPNQKIKDLNRASDLLYQAVNLIMGATEDDSFARTCLVIPLMKIVTKKYQHSAQDMTLEDLIYQMERKNESK